VSELLCRQQRAALGAREQVVATCAVSFLCLEVKALHFFDARSAPGLPAGECASDPSSSAATAAAAGAQSVEPAGSAARLRCRTV